MAVILCLVTCFILFFNTHEAARILAVFPAPSISHQVVFRPLTQELAKRGHDVTVITTDPAFPKGGAPANLTEIDLHDISYEIWKEQLTSAAKGNKDDLVSQMKIFIELFVVIFDAQLKHEEVKRLIHDKDQQFDLVIIEACFRSWLVFSHIYKAPVILMSSFGAVYENLLAVGAPMHPLLYPPATRQRLNNLTMWEKVTELYSHYMIEYNYHKNAVLEDKMLKKHFGADLPSVTEFNKNVDMMFMNVNPIFEGIRPVPPSVVYMGGIHKNPVKELPKDLKSFLDSSKNGVIYISFGTNVDPTKLPADRIQVMVKAVSQLPYDVLWKWNGDELPGRTANIRISKWLPQSDLLRHPKIKVFVTQAGLQSTDEAIIAGVPLIGVPMMADQWFNAEKYEYHKIGVKIDLDGLTEEKFKNTIQKVIGDDSYRQNIVKLRSLMQDQPQSPLERAVWWLEHVLRHGGAKHLRSPAANISWAEYLELELVLTLLAGLLAASIVLVFTACLLFKHFFRKFYVSEKTKKS